MPEPLVITEERWNGDLVYIREISLAERSRWRVSPPEMNYAEALRWARDELRADKLIRLNTGETLVRLPASKASPWGLT
jgi:hypothetical protein